MSDGSVPTERRQPLRSRLAPAHPLLGAILAAHERAIELGDDGYLDPATGFWVFTAQAHWERGRCCDSGCRHCPYATGERHAAP